MVLQVNNVDVVIEVGEILGVFIVGAVLITVAELDVLEDPDAVPSEGVTVQAIVSPTDKFETVYELLVPSVLPLESDHK